VVGAGRYFVISFWPYEEEAMRTIYDCLMFGRQFEKDLQDKIKELEVKNEELKVKDGLIGELRKELEDKDRSISQLSSQITQQEQYIGHLKKQTKKAVLTAEFERKEHRRTKEAYHRTKEAYHRTKEEHHRTKEEHHRKKEARRQQRLKQESARNERLRLRDPIHVYALSSGTGTEKNDWTLVLNYHKGAHDIKLGQVDPTNTTQSLEITENKNVFLFDLIVPQNINLIGCDLPVVPEKLCADF